MSANHKGHAGEPVFACPFIRTEKRDLATGKADKL
jgi:hypothetical protein